MSWARTLGFTHSTTAVTIVGYTALLFGVLGTLASAYIYLVPARPSWNMSHTPIDFLLSSALIGAMLAPALDRVAVSLGVLWPRYFTHTAVHYRAAPSVLLAMLWVTNQLVRLAHLHRSALFEGRAAFELLSSMQMRPAVMLCVGLGFGAGVCSAVGIWPLALIASLGAVITARYLFFVSVVPLSMGLTFVRGRHA